MDGRLNILFLTNFEDPCYQVIPAVSHWMAELESSVTILHAYERADQREQAEADIRSFFAEAEHYPDCRRIAMQGRVEDIAAQYCEAGDVDLVVAPADDALGLPRWFHRSVRARLMERIAVPLWTVNTRVDARQTYGPIRRIACHIDFETPENEQLKSAAELARRLGAKLHLIYATPPADEGLLNVGLRCDRPLHQDMAERRLNSLLRGSYGRPQIHVGTGEEEAVLPELLRRCKADLVFLGPGQALQRGIWGTPSLGSLLRRVPCPIICMDGAAAKRPPTWRITPRFTSVYEGAAGVLAAGSRR